MIATVPVFAPPRPASRPSQAETVTTWAMLVVLLLFFWYGVAVGVAALWGQLAG